MLWLIMNQNKKPNINEKLDSWTNKHEQTIADSGVCRHNENFNELISARDCTV